MLCFVIGYVRFFPSSVHIYPVSCASKILGNNPPSTLYNFKTL